MALPRQILCSLGAFAASTACLAGMDTTAAASNFVPQQQGEINVGLGCLDGAVSCLELDPIFASIESLVDDTSGTQSRLFVDYFGAGDNVVTYGSGNDRVQFKTKDAGTNSMGYWLRPSERSVGGGNEETGQLEVGTFRFNFAQTLAELTIDFFDTESWDSTGVVAINGVDLENPDYVAKGKDGNVVSQTFFNISSLDLKLGLDRASGTGDGVNFRMSGVPAQDVPEPAAAAGLLAIAGLGFARRQRGA
ncbi:LEVG family PEP-CTERM protein [Halomicronema sp. CCY15110]|uniref:LEVG family PEP-CTERM protein n=1 Tax=Halomicronema sp. CCY15110 TaxID=2767773 RepID=UPI00210580AA|nr:LEVG family PEP-CTERM protein [Halomicronema sp. CCY15110]